MQISKHGKLTEVQLQAIEMLITQDESGLTKEEIAEQLEIHPSTLWRWEKRNKLFRDTLIETAEEAQRNVLPSVYARLRGIITSPHTADRDRLKAIELFLKNQGRLTAIKEVRQINYNDTELTFEEMLDRLNRF
ncbi:phBC6A51 family helix-turn-helix protein [Jeotgalibaca porci]|uniref:phBC6A51 family helix-turn-helix protein n=1 Tax=Jeotgalibaca porci TaxID=1868793 RepID=UPI003F90024F